MAGVVILALLLDGVCTGINCLLAFRLFHTIHTHGRRSVNVIAGT